MGWFPCCCIKTTSPGTACSVCEKTDPSGLYKITFAGWRAPVANATFILNDPSEGFCSASFFSPSPFVQHINLSLSGIGGSGPGHVHVYKWTTYAAITLNEDEYEYCDAVDMIPHVYTHAGGRLNYTDYFPLGTESLTVDKV